MNPKKEPPAPTPLSNDTYIDNDTDTEFTSSAVVRDEMLNRVERDYEEFKKTSTFKFPTWLYGPPTGKLFKVELEDCPHFGNCAFVEFDSARTAFLSIDRQIDFCGPKSYVDVMGYDLGLTSAPISRSCLSYTQ